MAVPALPGLTSCPSISRHPFLTMAHATRLAARGEGRTGNSVQSANQKGLNEGRRQILTPHPMKLTLKLFEDKLSTHKDLLLLWLTNLKIIRGEDASSELEAENPVLQLYRGKQQRNIQGSNTSFKQKSKTINEEQPTKSRKPHEQRVDSCPPDDNKLYSIYLLLRATCKHNTLTQVLSSETLATPPERKSDKRCLVHYT